MVSTEFLHMHCSRGIQARRDGRQTSVQSHDLRGRRRMSTFSVLQVSLYRCRNGTFLIKCYT